MNEPIMRRIKSFVRRETRLSDAQLRAIETLWPTHGLDITDTPIDFHALFGNDKPVIVEIGIGNGASLLHQAESDPQCNYLGIEVHRPGVGVFLQGVEKAGLTNVRVSIEDAVEVFKHIPDQSLYGLQVFFPDPWHKKRHHKRRLIQPEFLNLVVPKLQIGGFIHCATDWEDYAHQMLDVLSSDARLHNTSPDNTFIERPDTRIVSKFEARGLKLGHGVWDLKFTL